MHRIASYIAQALIIGGLWIGLAAKPVQAQELLIGPSMSLEDAVSQFANPALMSFQRARLGIGAKAYHLGLGDAGGIPLRQGYVLLSSPFFFSDRYGAGTHVQYFDSPIYRRVAFGASLSARLFRFAAAGIRVEAMNLSYNQDEFVGFDPNDPVFADGFGKTILNVSAGIFAQPLPNMRLSLGARNLNRPDLSIAGDGVRNRIESFLGIAYGFGPMQALLEFVDTFNGPETRFGVEAVATSGSFLRVTSNDAFDLGRLEGQLHVGGPLSVAYGYELPFGGLGPSSGGSHTFSVVFDFGRSPELPDAISIPTYFYANELPDITPQLAPKVYISSSTDYVRFYEQQIVRSIGKDVPAAALNQLSAEDLGLLDSSFVDVNTTDSSSPVDFVSNEVRLQGSFSPLYRASMREIGRTLSQDSLRALTITGAGNQLLKAAGVRNYMVQEQAAPANQIMVAVRPDANTSARTLEPREERVLYDPERMTLFINSAIDYDPVQSWILRIADVSGKTIKTFDGTGNMPERIEWDWRDADGRLIEPGVYRYRIEWVDSIGLTQQSNERKLYVQKMLRKITIEVTRDIEALRNEADAVEIRIQH